MPIKRRCESRHEVFHFRGFSACLAVRTVRRRASAVENLQCCFFLLHEIENVLFRTMKFSISTDAQSFPSDKIEIWREDTNLHTSELDVETTLQCRFFPLHWIKRGTEGDTEGAHTRT